MSACARCSVLTAETPAVRQCAGWQVGDRIWDGYKPDPTFAVVERLVDWPGDCALARREGDAETFSLQCSQITGWRRVS
jgi:hypothetical protein